MTTATDARAIAEQAYRDALDRLYAIPGVCSDAYGLTPPEVRESPEYLAAMHEVGEALGRINEAKRP